jgi:hypothetical protein
MTTQDTTSPTYYTVSAIYCGNRQRYATGRTCNSPEEAAADAIVAAREDNQEPQEIEICAIFKGPHDALDVDVSMAAERPEHVPSRAKTMKPFTIVFSDCVMHVDAQNARLAECVNANEGDEVAGVFAGHLEDLSQGLDYDKVDAIVKAYEEQELAEA